METRTKVIPEKEVLEYITKDGKSFSSLEHAEFHEKDCLEIEKRKKLKEEKQRLRDSFLKRIKWQSIDFQEHIIFAENKEEIAEFWGISPREISSYAVKNYPCWVVTKCEDGGDYADSYDIEPMEDYLNDLKEQVKKIEDHIKKFEEA